MSGEQDRSEAVGDAISLDDTESVVWTGRPRVTVVIPAVVVGVACIALGLLGTTVSESWLPLVLVPIGVAIPGGRYLQNQNTQYVITDAALYKKTGVVSRTVSQAMLHTIQNSAYSQSLTGSLFGYGTVEFEIAGGGDFSYQNIANPQDVRGLVDQATGRADALSGSRPAHQSIPGSIEQWQAIRDEVHAISRHLER